MSVHLSPYNLLGTFKLTPAKLGLLAALTVLPLAMATPSLAETPPATSAPETPGPRLIDKSSSGSTYAMPEDYLAVTLVPPSNTPYADPLKSDLSIWVGEVEIQGRKTLWVELIDSYGEVIYNSEVQPNETHLLPDGRAIAVTLMQPESHREALQRADLPKDQARVPTDERFVVTQKTAFSASMDTQVKLLEVQPVQKEVHNSFMFRAGDNGEILWKATKDAITWLESKS
ncbi:hypothetical protein PsAD2_00221 [Pseudovibrio axinellae]|uniref:Uncharacterized protein n=1 Tax=Pseudovibrio axinellae TaxID=989403 RepID=A0A166B0X5_9HYPH|nr:hypothetical protein [Pseudovibrio axinellae]KZL21800.1 hypothetical protein PsAD2_00221 [Pseudovibrio axinellae]SEQ79029.1 hypothetical protein SAMN05421798_104215 [Pseudovibrio axinellae]